MAHEGSDSQEGRPAQRGRTRKAILSAAARLLEAGQAPSVNEIAAAAGVSRRTVYMYFPTIEQLLIDATLGTLSSTRAVPIAIEQSGDAQTRVETLARSLIKGSAETLRLGRTLIRLTVEAPNAKRSTPLRGYRRTEWIENALAPLRGRLKKKEYERLVSALSVFLGWEAMIVLADVRGLTSREQEDVVVWAAAALVKAALATIEQPENRQRLR